MMIIFRLNPLNIQIKKRVSHFIVKLQLLVSQVLKFI